MRRWDRQPRTLADFGGLTPAETRVLDELDSGRVIVIGDGELPPETAPPDRQVRASFVRWLALGGDETHRPHEKGARIAGALIVSDGPEDAETPGLDLEGCEVPRDLALLACRFRHRPLLRGARMASLFLNRAHLPGLAADGLTTTGDLVLRAAQVTGEIRLLGASVGGNLDCVGATLSKEGGTALTADRLTATGSVFLREARVTGEIRLLGASVGGALGCDGATLSNKGGEALSADRLTATGSVFLREARVTGEIRLLGASVGGNLSCVGATLSNEGGKALNAAGARISGSLFLRGGASVVGALDLTAAEIGNIDEDPACWPGPGNLLLDRCRYGAFTGLGVTAADRIRWLALQDPARWGGDFWPQPYEHCAKVLREMGHQADARAVLIEKERLQRAARRRTGSAVKQLLLRFRDGVLGITVAYGHRPLQAFLWLGAFWLFGALAFDRAADADAFKPNNPFVLRSPEWVLCGIEMPERIYLTSAQKIVTGRAAPGQSQLDCFLSQREAASYPTFNAWIYSADTLLPVVEIEQQVNWIPDPSIPAGAFAKAWLYVQILSGWALSLLAIAGFSGLVKSD